MSERSCHHSSWSFYVQSTTCMRPGTNAHSERANVDRVSRLARTGKITRVRKEGVTFVGNAVLTRGSGSLSSIQTVTGGAHFDAIGGMPQRSNRRESAVNNSSRRLNDETRQKWTDSDTGGESEKVIPLTAHFPRPGNLSPHPTWHLAIVHAEKTLRKPKESGTPSETTPNRLRRGRNA
jgi:hypothetical protein